MKFVDHVFDDQVIDHMTLKIILPEGSAYVNFICFNCQHIMNTNILVDCCWISKRIGCALMFKCKQPIVCGN